MTERVHIVLDAAEKERFRRWAEREGKSLSEWLREAGREKIAASSERGSLGSRKALVSFFEACESRERGREPDWEAHRRVIEGSIGSGAAP
ncbi:MAG: antitoxin [Gemmatimonadota bacterium]|jgi:hypothetical protein